MQPPEMFGAGPPCMGWQRGPLPPGTWLWGGVVPVGELQDSGGFFFADFKGDHVMIQDGKGKEGDGGWSRLEPAEVAWWNNCLCLPPTPEGGAT